MIWRLLGVRIGHRVFDDGCAIPEKTLVTIGDDVVLNAGSVIQCHSLEDGSFKSDRTVIGDGAVIGVGAFVHYGVTMGEGSVLEADAFLMKGETAQPFTRWQGNPATEVRTVAAAAPAPIAPVPVTAAVGQLRPVADAQLGLVQLAPGRQAMAQPAPYRSAAVRAGPVRAGPVPAGPVPAVPGPAGAGSVPGGSRFARRRCGRRSTRRLRPSRDRPPAPQRVAASSRLRLRARSPPARPAGQAGGHGQLRAAQLACARRAAGHRR